MKSLWLTLFAAAVSAAEPVGTLVSNGDFRVNGTQTPSKGTLGWPVAPGDEIALTAPAVLRINGGGRVWADAGSKLRVAAHAGVTSVRLVSGAMAFKLTGKEVVAAGSHDALPAQVSEGALSVSASAGKAILTSNLLAAADLTKAAQDRRYAIQAPVRPLPGNMGTVGGIRACEYTQTCGGPLQSITPRPLNGVSTTP